MLHFTLEFLYYFAKFILCLMGSLSNSFSETFCFTVFQYLCDKKWMFHWLIEFEPSFVSLFFILYLVHTLQVFWDLSKFFAFGNFVSLCFDDNFSV